MLSFAQVCKMYDGEKLHNRTKNKVVQKHTDAERDPNKEGVGTTGDDWAMK